MNFLQQKVLFFVVMFSTSAFLSVVEAAEICSTGQVYLPRDARTTLEDAKNLGEALSFSNFDGAYVPHLFSESNVCQISVDDPSVEDRLTLDRSCFRDAVLVNACMPYSDLRMTTFSRSDLTGSNFKGSDLHGSHLDEAHMNRAQFSSALMTSANLSDAHLNFAQLDNVNLQSSKLTNANLFRADLQQSNLTRADLTGADLREARLGGAKLLSTKVDRQTDFTGAYLHDVVFEPEGKLKAKNVVQARGLRDLQYTEDPAPLVSLADTLAKAGFDQAARDVRCSIERSHAKRSGPLIRFLRYLFFDLTYSYGAERYRPLIGIWVLIFLFSLIYFVLILTWKARNSGIWIIPKVEPFKKRPSPPFLIHRRITSLSLTYTHSLGLDLASRTRLRKALAAYMWAFYFSISCAFRFGFKPFDLASYITILQSRDYVLTADGLIRTISGVQSIFCMYLLALFLFAVFGVLLGVS